MKVISRTPTELIIRESAIALRGVGGVLIVVAGLVIAIAFTDAAGEPIGRVPLIVGSLLGLCGLALVLLPARKTFAFSRGDRIFVIASERLGRVERQTFPLSEIADVALEESRSSEGGSTYRVSATLADRRRVPWTSYYTSSYASQRAAVEEVRAFLRLETAPGEVAAAAAIDERSARQSRGLLVVMAAFCCLFLGIGATMLVKEQRKLVRYVPVQATVLSARVDSHSDSDGTTYEPVVDYRYVVGQRAYVASTVTPLRESRSGRWAHRTISRFRIGGRYTAYHDPDDPSKAFLVRSRSVVPWAFVAIPLVGIVFLGIGIANAGKRPRPH